MSQLKDLIQLICLVVPRIRCILQYFCRRFEGQILPSVSVILIRKGASIEPPCMVAKYAFSDHAGNNFRTLSPLLPTVAFSQTFAVRETDVSRHNGGTSGAPLKPLRDDSALRALSSLGIMGAP